MSPKQYQLCQRLLFAKQLLHDCNLPIPAVAEASGFNSSRSLQQQFRQRFNLSPLQLRRQHSTCATDILLHLHYRPPYNWEHLRDFLKLRALTLLESVAENSYARRFELDDVAGSFTATHNPQKHCFDVVVAIDNLQKLKPLLKNIRRVLDLDADPQAIAGSLADAGIGIHRQLSGIRLPGVWSLFEAGCRAICGQQVSVAGSLVQVNRLVEQLGRLPDDLYRFPSPHKVARSALDFLGMPQSRRNTLKAFARAAADKPGIDPEELLDIKGIGRWTVDYIRMRGTGYPDIWLEHDLIVRRQQEKLKLDAGRAAPWRSYLTLQLWSMA
jgi:AraC family transcriptional regulator of adaptative response / DNA-3-methyladenine glycosylase II